MRFERSARPRRRPGLTPLIDVVFLLLVFFMLATRFEREALLPLSIGAASAASSSLEPGADDALGKAVVVEIDAQGTASVAGRVLAPAALRAAITGAADTSRPVRVRPDPETKLQAIADVLGVISEAGAEDVALEGR